MRGWRAWAGHCVLWIKAFVRVGTDVVLDVMPRVRLVERPQVGAALALFLRHQLQIDLRCGARTMR